MDSWERKSILRLLSQYDFEVDPKYPNEGLTCIVCDRLMVEAYQTYCGCKYCRRCIINHLDGMDEYCGGGKRECREEPLVLDRNVTSNAALNRQISKLRVVCPYESCGFINELCEMEEHMELCAHKPMECPYLEIGCDCGKMSKKNMETHLQTAIVIHSQLVVESIKEQRARFDVSLEDAVNARIKCDEDQRNESIMKNKEINDIRSQMRREQSESSSREAQRSKVMRSLKVQVEAGMQRSVALEAEVRRLTDEFKAVLDESMDIRAEATIMRTQMDAEIGKFRGISEKMEVRSERVAGMRVEMERLKEEITRIKEKSTRAKDAARLAKVEEELKICRAEREAEMAESEKMRGEVATLSTEVTEIHESNARLETEHAVTRNRVMESGAEGAATVKRVDELARRIDDLNTWKDGEGAVGKLWFTVDGMAARMTERGGRIESPYLYSHANGYKLRIRVHTRWNGTSCLGVSSVVCRGEYDDVLPWPCKFTLSVSVVRKHKKQPYATRIIEFGSNIDSRFSKRAIDRDNFQYGGISLASHSDIRSSKIIFDDSLLFHVVVGR